MRTFDTTPYLQNFSRQSTRASVSWTILSCDVVPLVNAGIFQNFANKVCNKDWLLFLRGNPLKNDCPVCPHGYFANGYSKCTNNFVLQPSIKKSCLQFQLWNSHYFHWRFPQYRRKHSLCLANRSC